MKWKPLAIALTLVLVPALSAEPAAAQEKPNIVVMMVDNLGWGELGVYGGGVLRGAETPRLDTLADEGLRMLNFNVEPQCTPSRSAFMTGRHPIRSGTTKVVWGLPYGLVGWEKTMAELEMGISLPLMTGTPISSVYCMALRASYMLSRGKI